MSMLPSPPSLASIASFEEDADAFLGALPDFGDTMEIMALAAASSGIAAYSSGTTYAAGDVVVSGGTFWISRVGSNLNHAPASSPSYWYNWLATKANTNSPVFSGGASGAAAVLVGASAIDCALGHVFTKTAVGALAWTFSNVPAGFFAGVLELTNGGLGAQTLPSGSKVHQGGAFSFSASGKDLLSFYTPDGGTTTHWAMRAQAVG